MNILIFPIPTDRDKLKAEYKAAYDEMDTKVDILMDELFGQD